MANLRYQSGTARQAVRGILKAIIFQKQNIPRNDQPVGRNNQRALRRIFCF
jgi:hypothetical protein